MNHYIISSKASLDRRRNIQEQFSRYDLGKPQFFDAIMGAELSDKDLAKSVDPRSALTPGEIGCGISHLSIFKTFLQTNNKAVLIFEDDIVFHHTFSKNILKSAFSFIENASEPTALLLHTSRFRGSLLCPLKDNITIHKVNEISRTHAYIINRTAAQNILSLQSPLKFVIDCWRYYSLLGLVNVHCLNYNLVWQSEDFPSMIRNAHKIKNQSIYKQQDILKSYLKTLPKEEQSRIRKERLLRTFLRIKHLGLRYLGK